jgi:hypothetical protein
VPAPPQERAAPGAARGAGALRHPVSCLARSAAPARRGRKKAALTYVATYTIGCFTKHWNMFWVLFVGRLFCGVATSLLYSAFESWLVAEHFKARAPPRRAPPARAQQLPRRRPLGSAWSGA